MSSATNSTGPTKHVRFSAQGKTPSEMARDRVSLAVASLPESMKQWAEHWCAKINTAHTKWYRHKTTMTRLKADPEFIPRSARTNFTLTGSRLATEHEIFKELTASLETYNAKVQKKWKRYIIDAAKLENSILEKEFATLLSQAIISFAQINLLAKSGKQPPSEQLNHLVNETFSALTTTYTKSMSAEDNAALYTEVTGFPYAASSGDIQNDCTTTTINFRDQFIIRCRKLFIDPIEAFIESEKANAVSTTVTQFATSLITGNTTATTALALDDEPTVPAAQMESLINKSVKKSTEALRTQIRELKSLAKNSTRGAPATSASLKKKKLQEQETTEKAPAKRKRKNTSAATAVPKAAAANNVTSGNNTRNTKKTGRGKSNQKNASNTGAIRSKKN